MLSFMKILFLIIQSDDLNNFSLPIPQNYAQTHDDFYMHTENINDTNSSSNNTLEIDNIPAAEGPQLTFKTLMYPISTIIL